LDVEILAALALMGDQEESLELPDGCLVPSAVRRQSVQASQKRPSVGAAALAAAFIASTKAAKAKREASKESSRRRASSGMSSQFSQVPFAVEQATAVDQIPEEEEETELQGQTEVTSGSVLGVLMVVLAAKRFKDRRHSHHLSNFRWDISGVDYRQYTYGKYFESPTFNLGADDHNSGGCCLHFWPCWDEHCHCVKLIIRSGREIACRLAVDGKSKEGKTIFQASNGTSALIAFFTHGMEEELLFSNVDVQVLEPTLPRTSVVTTPVSQPASAAVEEVSEENRSGDAEEARIGPAEIALATARSVEIQVDDLLLPPLAGCQQSASADFEGRELALRQEVSDLEAKLNAEREAAEARENFLKSTNTALEAANLDLRTAMAKHAGGAGQMLAVNFPIEELLERKSIVAALSREQAVSKLLDLEARALELAKPLGKRA